MKKLKFIHLFAGCGGLTEGFYIQKLLGHNSSKSLQNIKKTIR